MAAFQEAFANRILQIPGVGGFFLVQNDGQVLASKTDMSIKPQTLAAMMILSGRDCTDLQAAMGFSRYHYLMLSQKNGEKLYIFPIQDHFLGVIHKFPEHDPSFIKKIKQFIHYEQPFASRKPSS